MIYFDSRAIKNEEIFEGMFDKIFFKENHIHQMENLKQFENKISQAINFSLLKKE